MAQRFVIPAFQKMTKFHYAKREGQFHNYDLPYMHFNVLVWYCSYHYVPVFVLLPPFQRVWRLQEDLIQVYSF